MTTLDADDRRPLDGTLLSDGGAAAPGGTLVGLTTAEGVVLVADTRTTRGTVVRSESVRKVAQVHPTAALGSTGDLGDVQAFVRALRATVDRYESRHGEPIGVSALGTVAVERLRSESGPAGRFLLGGVDADGCHVLTLDRDAGVLEDAYAAVGTGSQLAYGVLDADVADSIAMAEARRVAGRAVQSAAGRDAATGIGVHVAEITDTGVDVRRHDDVQELL